ncbi:VOC family protein [Nakamurella sp.]|uniref:VOC family protein n=1 Tax=Nakamurella sp. TaxID=1869182 RepID=UPI003783B8E9
MPADIFWTSAFLDFEPSGFEVGVRFWADVTGYALSPRRGDSAEFATLVPPAGDDFLRVQRLRDGPSRRHLDLHVPDPGAAARVAVDLGAAISVESPHGYVVLTSPGGFTFCFVSHRASARPEPARWGEHISLVDQLCLDVRAADADAETQFWSELTGWPPTTSSISTLFPLVRPPGMPLRLMVQAVGDDRFPATAHLDLAGTDRSAETERHQVLGAAVQHVADKFTVLHDPAGAVYCITDRDPVTVW